MECTRYNALAKGLSNARLCFFPRWNRFIDVERRDVYNYMYVRFVNEICPPRFGNNRYRVISSSSRLIPNKLDTNFTRNLFHHAVGTLIVPCLIASVKYPGGGPNGIKIKNQ